MSSPRAENQERTAPPDEEVRAPLEQARAAAAGILASGVVHEFANLLTVVDGMRQMGALAPDAAPKLSLLDQPADRCGAVVEAFRHVFSDQGLGPSSFSARVELACLEGLLRAHLRGLPTRVEAAEDGADVAIDGGLGRILRPAFLCVLLGRFERGRAVGAVPPWVGLSARAGGGGDVEFAAHLARAATPPPGSDEAPRRDPAFAERVERIGEELVRAAGGGVDEEETEDPEGTLLRVRVRG